MMSLVCLYICAVVYYTSVITEQFDCCCYQEGFFKY